MNDVAIWPMAGKDLGHWMCAAYWDDPPSSCLERAVTWVEVGTGLGRVSCCRSEKCAARLVEMSRDILARRYR